MLAAIPPARRRLLLAAVVVIVVAVVAAVIAVSRNGSSGRAASAELSQATAGPVLLVPGYGGSTTSLKQLAVRLQQAGRDTTVVSLPDGGVGDLNVQARTLGAAVTAVRKRTGAATVDVVGYSAGGVVARLWVRNDGGSTQARRIISLGSPQHGTSLADLGALLPSECPTACQQLTTTSSLLADLNAGDETPVGPTFVSIWTTHDDVVMPPESDRLQGAAVNLAVQTICPANTVNHTGLPSNPQVEAIVVAELAAGPPPTLTSADCAAATS